ncbi:MAG: hypothetical protein MMC23_001069 [Stictis urceolatum]|nr:hypothetical protein [Stictis urceolata]
MESILDISADLNSVLRLKSPPNLSDLLLSSPSACDDIRCPVFKQFVAQTSHIDTEIFGSNHPLSLLCSYLTSLHCTQLHDVIRESRRVLSDLYGAELAMNSWSIHEILRYKYFNDPSNLMSAAKYFFLEVKNADVDLDGPRLSHALLFTARAPYDAGDYAAAEHSFAELLSHNYLCNDDDQIDLYLMGCEGIASLPKAIRDRCGAFEFMWKSVRMASSIWHLHGDATVALWLDKMRRWQLEWGELEAAQELKCAMPSLMKPCGWRSGIVKREDPNCTEPIEW